MRNALFITTALAGALIATTAGAQTGTTPTPPEGIQTDPSQSPPATGTAAETASSSATPADQLGDIIVTAQRRSENLQNAAVAVDVVTGDALTRSGISSPYQLGSVIPSLSVSSGGGANTTFFLRGVGNFTNNGYNDPAIAFNYDGVYVGRPSSTAGVLYDLERVEVLKGPQGTLYGRNATAGAINVIPARPEIGANSGFVNAGYGNYDAIDLQGAVNLAVGSESALRLSGNWTRHDGYLSDGTNDDDTVGLRAQFLTRPTADLSLRLSADYAHVGGKGAGVSYDTLLAYNPVANSYSYLPTNFDRSVGVLDPRAQTFRTTRLFSAFLGGRLLGPVLSDVYNDNSYYGISAEIGLETGAGTLTVIPAFREANLDYKSDVFSGTAWIREKDTQYSLEARFAGKRLGIFDYIVGAHYFDETVDGDDSILQDALAVFQDFVIKTKSYAVFGRLTANVSDRLRLVGGLRYTHDNKKFNGQADVILEACPTFSCPTSPVFPLTDTAAQLPLNPRPTPNGPPVPIGATGALAIYALTAVNKGLETSKFTYRAAVEFDLGERSLLYASYETGFRSGGFSVSFGKETYQPEYITAYTIGSKNRLFDNRLQLNVEAFLWQYRNQQVNHTGIDGNGVQGQFTENVGKSVNKGFEVEARLLATRNTLLSANLQYLDTNYKNFSYTYPLGAIPAVGCPVTVSATAYTINCSGKPAYNAPKWTINLGAQQTVPLGDYKLVLAGDTQYRSSRFVGFEYLDFQRAPSVWQSNASIDFAPRGDKWNLGVFVRNIENKRVLANSIIFPVGSVSTAVTTPPRTYGVRGSIKF